MEKTKDKTIADYLPRKMDTTLVQARVPKHLVKSVKQVIETQNIGWSELIRACLEKFLDESVKR